MTGPSRCKRTNWKWREFHKAGRLEAMEEVRDWLASKKQWAEDMNATDGVKAIIDEFWVILSANCERGGEWSSSKLMKKEES